MEKDKKLHFIAGFILGLIGTLIHPALGMVLSVSAGIGKEIYDYFGRGCCEFNDLIATVLGGAFGSLIILGCELL